jgi:glycosyltransferase involved in cell wall biosynthesis
VIAGGVDARFTPGAADADAGATARRLGLERPYVLTVATDDPRKNLSSLARAAGELAALGIELVWAGDARPYFGDSAPVAGLRSLGYVSDRDLPGLYRDALAFTLPSRYEGFGLTCLEAMACGTPVVAADRAALPETCGGAALLADPDDERGFAAAVVRAATDTPTRSRLRAEGLARAACFDWDRAATATDALLTELAGG